VDKLTKAFGGELALDSVALEVRPGEVHALLGPNGAGKSTLIKCLSGAIKPSSGSIEVGGVRYSSLTPRESLEAGVAVIYQQFSLVPSLTVAENVFFGSELRRAQVLVRGRKQREVAQSLLERLGAPISPDTRVGDLPVASQQLVEIAKAIHRNAELLILDEPTASLSEAEASRLMEQVKRLKEENIQILYVTHLLGEVFEVADRVTVLRDGRVSLSDSVTNLTQDDIVRAIAGDAPPLPEPSARERGPVLLRVEDLEAEGIGPVSLSVSGGEVLGVFGLMGSGRTELLETVFGVRRMAGGRMDLLGRAFSPSGPGDSVARGVALVPAERLRQSMLPTLSTLDNLLLAGFSRLGRFGLRRGRAESERFETTARRIQLRPSRPDIPAWTLSGGNQQKLAVGRWLGAEQPVRLLMLDDPTQGIDIGAKTELFRVLQDLVSSDPERGILFTTSSPEEVVAVADRAIVLHKGSVVGELTRESLSEDRLLAMAHAVETA
jgi:ABC-type sugar transport system ATPase subunit